MYSVCRSNKFRVIHQDRFDTLVKKWGLKVSEPHDHDDMKSSKMVKVISFETPSFPTFPISNPEDMESDFLQELGFCLGDQWGVMITEIIDTSEKKMPIARCWSVNWQGKVRKMNFDEMYQLTFKDSYHVIRE